MNMADVLLDRLIPKVNHLKMKHSDLQKYQPLKDFILPIAYYALKAIKVG